MGKRSIHYPKKCDGMKKIMILWLTFLSVSPFALAQKLETKHINQLQARHIGPVGNRVNSVSGVAGDPLTYIVGAASGGVWKTIDGGLTWRPVFDQQEVHSIGSIAIAPSDPQVVYVGTGESFIRSNVSIGKGMYKSTDGGETWTHIGLEATGRISRVLVHPDDANIVYVAALGHSYAPQEERGIWKTTDGGTTWKQVLFVSVCAPRSLALPSGKFFHAGLSGGLVRAKSGVRSFSALLDERNRQRDFRQNCHYQC